MNILMNYHQNKKSIELFHLINDLLNNYTKALENNFVQFKNQNFLFDDSSEEHLPSLVFSYVRPTFGTQFILHILLSLGSYVTEIDLLH